MMYRSRRKRHPDVNSFGGDKIAFTNHEFLSDTVHSLQHLSMLLTFKLLTLSFHDK